MRYRAVALVLALSACRSPAPASPNSEAKDTDQGSGGGDGAAVESGGEGAGEDGSGSANATKVEAGVSVETTAPTPAKPAPGDVELELTLDRRVSWGYGCGGHCASNTEGSSSVALLCLVDGKAWLSDAGHLSHTMSYPDGAATEKTSWSQVWTGECTRQKSVLVLELERTTNVCVRVSEVEDGKELEEKCPESQGKMLLGCRLEDVTVVDEIPAAGEAKGGKTVKAWKCNPEPEDLYIGGTPAPWVFGDTGCVDTWFVGEPKADTHYKLCE